MLTRFATGSRFAGLEVQPGAETTQFYLVVLRKKRQRLSVEHTAAFTHIEELPAHVSKDIPLALAIAGKGVLHRRVAVDPGADARTVLSKALPNASAKDFYIQQTPAAADEQFVSVLRRSAADELFLQLKQLSFAVVSCSLGPLPMISVLPLLDKTSTALCAGKHLLVTKNDLPADVQFLEEPGEASFTIGDQLLAGEYLIAFSAALQQAIAVPPIAANVEQLENECSEHRQRHIFRMGVKAILAATFIILLANYAMFLYYWSKKNELDGRLDKTGGAYAEVQQLEAQVSGKRAFLEQAGLLVHARHSYYADRLANELPAEIRLSRLAIAPRLQLAEEDSIGFRSGCIEIAGSCTESVALNHWLNGLKEKSWVKSATLDSYLQEKNMNAGEFKVIVTLQ